MCPWSWAAEPWLARLGVEFGDQAQITYVMGGLVRALPDPVAMLGQVLDAAARSGMPVDPRLWLERPPASSQPASLAVKAAAEQGLDGRYLRVLREGIMCERRPLDTAAALVDAAGRVAGIDVARFASALRSSAIVEALGADVERAAAAAASPPALELRGEDGIAHPVDDPGDPAALRAAALAAGGEPGPLPSSLDALARFGRMATAEVAAVCDLPGPLAAAELWGAAAQWRVRPQRIVNGELWSVAG